MAAPVAVTADDTTPGTSSEVPPVSADATAGDGDSSSASPSASSETSSAPGKWRGYVIPLFGANSTDGFGLGLGGELFRRPADQAFGYRFKLSASSWFTTGGYTSQWAQVEVRGDVQWLFRFDYQTWNNLPYAGVGGADVATLWKPEEEIGNRIRAPYWSVAAAKPIAGEEVRAYAALYVHPTWVRPAPGGLLDQRDAFGADGGTYSDVLVGVEREETDRWPMPNLGWRGEVDARGGGTFVSDGFHPLVGVHGEWIGWHPVVGKQVVGARLMAEKSFGDRPIYEQFITGGRFRDELGIDQVLSGYGRIRTRGDGVVAGAVEVRPFLFDLHPAKWDLQGYLSLYAEQAWLFAGDDPGPPMPTVGGGPELLWQKGSQIRPFVSVGWRSDVPGGERYPYPLYGLSVMDPL